MGEHGLIGEANQTKFYESQLVTDLTSPKQSSFVSIPAKADSPVKNPGKLRGETVKEM